MNTQNLPIIIDEKTSRHRFMSSQAAKNLRILSWLINLIFLASLIWAIYQAVVDRKPLPIWAWLGMVVLFAVAAGLVVMVVVYRGVSREIGPVDFNPSSQVAGELRSESRRVATDGAKALKVEIKMTAGSLSIKGDTVEALEATFTYDDADWKPPQVDYVVTGDGKGNMVVEQNATGRPAMKPGHCEWDIRLNQILPTELKVKLGVGKADLRLANLQLTHLYVESGVGELNMDLSGKLERNVMAFVKSGIGDTTLQLPQDVGVRIQSSTGIGNLQPHGLAWDGRAYTNNLYSRNAVTLDIIIEGGMGKISMI